MENNFEDHIKNMMENPSGFPFEERLWEDMETRLDNDGSKKPFLGFIGRFPLFLLALFTSGLALFFYLQQYKAIKKVEEMEKRFQPQADSKVESHTEKHVTVIYDTIYRRIDVDEMGYQANKRKAGREGIYNNVNFVSRRFASMPSFSNSLNVRKAAVTNYDFRSFLNGNKNSFKNTGKIQEGEDRKNNTEVAIAMQMLPTLSYSFLKEENFGKLSEIEFVETKRKKKLSYYLRHFEPTSYAFYGTMGTFTSLNLGAKGFNLRGSFQTDIGFGKGLLFTVGAEYFSNDFGIRIDEENPDLPDGFPDIPALNNEDVLNEITGDFTYLQIPFGVKYIINPVRYFYPYAGIGIVASKATKSRLEYEYVSTLTGAYSVSEGKLLPNAFDLNAFWSNLGFQLRLTKHWSLLVEGGAQFNLEKGTYKYEDLEILKMSTGFQYKF